MQEEYEVTHFRSCKGALGSWICSQMPGNVSNHNPQGKNRRKQSFVDVTKENLVRNIFFHDFSMLGIWKLSQELMVWIHLCMSAAAHLIITFTSNKRVVSTYSQNNKLVKTRIFIYWRPLFFTTEICDSCSWFFLNTGKMHFFVKTCDVI